MGITAKLKKFKAPQRNLPRELVAFERKLASAHEELRVLGSGKVTPGVKRMAERLRLRLEKDYAALAPLKNKLEDEAGVFFNYDTLLYESVVADIMDRASISNCPVLFVCNAGFISLYVDNKIPYRAHYLVNPLPEMRAGITVYPEFYLSDAEGLTQNSINPAHLLEAYSLRNDATDVVNVMQGDRPPKVKLAIAISEMMSSSSFGITAEALADQRMHVSVVHELAHFFHTRWEGGRLDLNSMDEAGFVFFSSEVLASAAELVYGIDPRASLGSFLGGELLPKPIPQHRQVIYHFNNALIGEDPKDVQEMLPAYLHVPADEVREIARELLDTLSETLFGKPWSEIADESGFEEARKIVFED